MAVRWVGDYTCTAAHGLTQQCTARGAVSVYTALSIAASPKLSRVCVCNPTARSRNASAPRPTGGSQPFVTLVALLIPSTVSPVMGRPTLPAKPAHTGASTHVPRRGHRAASGRLSVSADPGPHGTARPVRTWRSNAGPSGAGNVRPRPHRAAAPAFALPPTRRHNFFARNKGKFDAAPTPVHAVNLGDRGHPGTPRKERHSGSRAACCSGRS